MGKAKTVTGSTRLRGVRVPHKIDKAIEAECKRQKITYSQFVVGILGYATQPDGDRLRMIDDLFFR
ncbi:hypothetical protein ACP1PC_000545 [Escherichia coli]|uniref:hypothetical protein n=1 Tax=Escherichia coli TaxID=562 RepID=UPI000B7DFE22|nr:hypothetical protein [Escherichia coli]EGO4135399.1 hypothetical protein [Escherichia coli]EHL6433999.1 hypothetical protein [Escherichia coli]HAX1982253.1 hypothetical protein [Escherichia coli]HBQ4879736.1 hypothetical protein [Escherichia coli]HDH7174682.1 hypothetical protein [Escherichia coli]